MCIGNSQMSFATVKGNLKTQGPLKDEIARFKIGKTALYQGK